ncbi:MAG: hypothetical protein GC171_10105 [Terrimonas sp.]|nr:hypothetical protein [Terrimonas sp.]
MFLLASLQVSLADLIMLTAGGTLLGATIFYFFSSRKSQKNSPLELQKVNKGLDEWKRKYFNDIEAKEKQIDELSHKNYESMEDLKVYKMEIEELKKQIRDLSTEVKTVKPQTPGPVAGKTDYMSQLQEAQYSLLEHNEKINQLLQQIDVVKETEEKQREMIRNNQELSDQIEMLKKMLGEKESEIDHIRQKQNLTTEMSSMLDNAYSEFNILQSKIVKLESQLSSSKMVGIEYEDLKEVHYKMTRQLEETRNKLNTVNTENQQLRVTLTETEDKLREANSQRQQLQKKVSYLEELNNDLKQMSEANKKLEGQIRRIGELESMLNIIAEERDELKKKGEE